MFLFHLKRSAAISGTLVLMVGCAQDPGVVIPTTADNCILLCALIRSLTGEAEPEPPAPIKPVKKVHVAKARTPVASRRARRQESPEATVEKTISSETVEASPASETRVPRDTPVASDELSTGFVHLPGSTSIAQVTSHFVPR